VKIQLLDESYYAEDTDTIPFWLDRWRRRPDRRFMQKLDACFSEKENEGGAWQSNDENGTI